MALQAGVRAVFRGRAFEGKDEPFPFGFRMFHPRTMAGFAFFSPMRILLKKIVNVRVAPFTGLRTCIPLFLSLLALLCLPLLLAKRREADEGYQDP